ncbi:Uncharacterised protein [Mycobacteroides abscessus subsp. abscessus]|nr:Uncharacterised protein [Mycobacteroides abscessus subsp. abscessus]
MRSSTRRSKPRRAIVRAKACASAGRVNSKVSLVSPASTVLAWARVLAARSRLMSRSDSSGTRATMAVSSRRTTCSSVSARIVSET